MNPVFSQVNIENFRSALQAIMETEEPPVTSQEGFVGRNLDLIEDFLKRGYPASRVVDVMKAHGIEISTSTLRTYIRRQRAKRMPKSENRMSYKGRLVTPEEYERLIAMEGGLTDSLIPPAVMRQVMTGPEDAITEDDVSAYFRHMKEEKAKPNTLPIPRNVMDKVLGLGR